MEPRRGGQPAKQNGGFAHASAGIVAGGGPMSDFRDDTFGDFSSPFHVEAEARRAPWWPLLMGVAFLLVSGFLALMGQAPEDAAPLYIGVMGYVLTPLGTAFTLIMAMRAHRKLSGVDGYVADSGTRLVKFCAIIAITGFLLAIPHIWQVADYFALLFAPGA